MNNIRFAVMEEKELGNHGNTLTINALQKPPVRKVETCVFEPNLATRLFCALIKKKKKKKIMAKCFSPISGTIILGEITTQKCQGMQQQTSISITPESTLVGWGGSALDCR